MANYKIVGSDGDPCPRCGQPTQIREHKTIRPRELRQPFYYWRWYYCTNRKCKTNTIVPPRFRVYRDEAVSEADRRLVAIKEQLGMNDDDDHHIGSPDWHAFKHRDRR